MEVDNLLFSGFEIFENVKGFLVNVNSQIIICVQNKLTSSKKGLEVLLNTK